LLLLGVEKWSVVCRVDDGTTLTVVDAMLLLFVTKADAVGGRMPTDSNANESANNFFTMLER
jgi:hypothetical protein